MMLNPEEEQRGSLRGTVALPASLLSSWTKKNISLPNEGALSLQAIQSSIKAHVGERGCWSKKATLTQLDLSQQKKPGTTTGVKPAVMRAELLKQRQPSARATPRHHHPFPHSLA